MSDVRPARRIPSLDGLRALSIALVVGSHVLRGWDTWWLLLWNGNLGVRVFFVISGFLITALLLAEHDKTGRIDLKRFYVRRAFRILPVVTVFLGVVAVLTARGLLDVSAVELWWSLFFVRDWITVGWFTGHFWSLAVEEQFYVFWPSLILWSIWRRAFPVAVALLLVAPLWRAAAYVYGLPGALLPNVDALMMGALLALARHAVPERIERLVGGQPAVSRLLAFALMLLSAAPSKLFILGVVTVPFTWTVQALCATYLIASYTMVERGWSYRLLNWKPVAWIGVLSYSLYVWQQLFLVPPDIRAPWVNLVPHAWPLRVGLAFGAAVVSYYAVETPLLRLRERLETRPVSPAAAVEAPSA